MKLQFLGIIAVLFLLAGCANLPSQNTWNSLTGQDGRTWGYTQIQEAAQAKAIFSRPFNAKGRGRTYSRHQIKFDQIVLPPNSLNTLKLRTYCLDKSDPAPKRNEKLYLVPVGKMIDSQIFPIYSSLMKYSHSHPEKHTQIQRIIWNLRSTKNPSEIRNEDYALLDTIHPGASQIVHSYFNTKKLTGMATDFLSDTAGKFLNQHGLGKNLLNQQNLVSTALHSLSQSNRQVNSILRSLESMPVSGLIPNDNSDYSLLTDGVAVKATHRGGARSSELTIRNTTDHPVVFQPAQFALESKRKTQRLGVGGVDNIKQEIEDPVDPVRYYITFIARKDLFRGGHNAGHAFVQWIKVDDNSRFTKVDAFGFYPDPAASQVSIGFDYRTIVVLKIGDDVPGRLQNEYLQHDGIAGDTILRVRVNEDDYRRTQKILKNWKTQYGAKFGSKKVPSDKYNLVLRNCLVFADTIAKAIGSKAYPSSMNPSNYTVKNRISEVIISKAYNMPQNHVARSWDLPLEIPQHAIMPYSYVQELRNKNASRHTSIGQLYPTNLSR
ncbi:MAG: hypothetical protein D3915_07075 [Candidatus Electrothrix sp. AU1_5]|nr:hypothetical protein [Candidatus Electrothrix gigas]